MSISMPPIRFRKPITDSGMSPVTFTGHDRKVSSAPPFDTFASGASTPKSNHSMAGKGTSNPTRQLFQALHAGDHDQLAQAMAVLKDQTPIANVLNPDTGLSPIITAAILGDEQATRKLLDAGAPVYSYSPEGMPLLHVAAADGGNVAVLKALQAAGLDVKTTHDREQRNSLHAMARQTPSDGGAAERENRQQIIQWLVAQGVDLNGLDQLGLTPYLTAVGSGNIGMMKALQAAGADVRAQTSSGMTSLHWAAGLNQGQVINHLLSPENKEAQQLDPNVPMVANGNTPLHLAVDIPNEEPSNREAIDALLARGADWHVANHAGHSPWRLAQSKGQAYLDSLSGLPLPAVEPSLIPQTHKRQQLPAIEEVTPAEEGLKPVAEASEPDSVSPEVQSPIAQAAHSSATKGSPTGKTGTSPSSVLASPSIQRDPKPHPKQSAKATPQTHRGQKKQSPPKTAGPVPKKTAIQAVPPTLPKAPPSNPFALLSVEPLPENQQSETVTEPVAPRPPCLEGTPPDGVDTSAMPAPTGPANSQRKTKKKKTTTQSASQSNPTSAVKSSGKTKLAKGQQVQSEALDEIDRALMEVEGCTTNTKVKSFDQVMWDNRKTLGLLKPDQQLKLISSEMSEHNVNRPYYLDNTEAHNQSSDGFPEPEFLMITPLHAALQSQLPLSWVLKFMELGAKPYARDGLGRTPFHYAALSENTAYLEALAAGKKTIRTGKDLTSLQDIMGETPLHYAAQLGRLENAKWLLEHGVPVNARPKGGKTALHYAALNGYTGVADLLLQNKANANAQDEQGLTALHMAAKAGYTNMAKLLLTHGADPNQSNHVGETPMHLAAALPDPTDCSKILTILLAKGAKVDPQRKDDSSTPLMEAIRLRNEMAFSMFLANGADITRSTRSGQNIFHQMMLQRDYKTEDQFILTWLLNILSKEEKARLLNAPIGKEQDTPLHTACSSGKMNAMQAFLNHGADPRAVNCAGKNALHVAVDNINVEEIPDMVTNLLEHAHAHGDKAMLHDLLTARTKPEGKQKQGKTALDLARRSPYPGVNGLIAEILNYQLAVAKRVVGTPNSNPNDNASTRQSVEASSTSDSASSPPADGVSTRRPHPRQRAAYPLGMGFTPNTTLG